MKKFKDDGKELKADAKVETARKAAFEAINKKAILVTLVRRQLSNLPYDVKTTKEVAQHLNVTDEDMIQVRKFLFHPQRLSPIRSLINDASILIWNQTRPWDNMGYRLLPIDFYDDFNERFDQIKIEFEEQVNKFVDSYDDALKESKKLLGKAYNKNDYPAKAQLKDLFVLKVDTTGFPDIDDIRLNLSGPELVEMRQDIVDKYKEVLDTSMDELVTLVESDNVDNVQAFKLIEIIDLLNTTGENSSITMKLAEIKEKVNYTRVDDDSSMMLMDDDEDLNELEDEDNPSIESQEDEMDTLI